jgi:UDP-glucuronate 4-epimerase
MNVLVTGGAGFIGSTLVDRLLADGHRVTALDNFDPYYDPAAKRRNLGKALSHPAFRLVEDDVRDLDAVRAIYDEARPDVVMHIAARAGVRPSLEDPRAYVEVNILGTLNLLDAAREFGEPKLVIASTSSVYGESTPVPFREDAVLDSIVSPYAASKLGMEALCHAYSSVHGLRIAVLRLFTVYGPRQRPDMAIHKFVRQIDRGLPIDLFGGGGTYRDYTYVDDIVSGFAAALGYDGAPWGIFNLGGGRPTDLRALVAEIERAVGKPAVVREAAPADGDVPRTLADITRARESLGYDPQVTVAEGVPRFVRWYRETDAAS